MDQLESLLNELQTTTTALKQAHRLSADYLREERPESSYSSDKEPIYEPQSVSFSPGSRMATSSTATYSEQRGLQDLEQLLDDYSSHRGRTQKDRPTVESLLGELDQASVSNGQSKKQPSASTASKELDNLMSSLSEFKIRSVTRSSTTTTTKTVTPQLSPAAGQTNVDSSTAAYSHLSKGTNSPGYRPINGGVEQQTAQNLHIHQYDQTSPGKFPSTTVAGGGGGGDFLRSAPLSADHRAVKSAGDTDQLDAILGNLSSDLSKHGIATIPKGDCAACRKTIVGQVVIALGKMWHPEHFTCIHCKEELGHRNFFERAGCAYCEKDYHELFSPRCAYCNGPIKDKCVTALEKTWHPEHFFCATCGKEFGDEGFHEKDGRAFCRQDYFSAFAPKCRGCKRAITNNYITALNHQWHPECFVCQECRQPFTAGSFFDHEDQPYCETHYHEKRGSLCASCQTPITGKCVTAMGKKYHPEHFVCSFCLQQLNKGTFKEHEQKPYCHKCFAKLLQ